MDPNEDGADQNLKTLGNKIKVGQIQRVYSAFQSSLYLEEVEERVLMWFGLTTYTYSKKLQTVTYYYIEFV